MRLTGWAVAGILAAMLAGTIDAFASSQLALGRNRLGRLFPRDWFDG